ncbi:MAG: helix-turn-helix transcriptional regulator [Sphingobium sp.]|nr:helix-turn-helix transcriptional regulator [Sphingobium sp.]
MQLTEQSREHRVEEARQAAAFQNQLRCRVLLACTLSEKTLSQLEEDIRAPLSKLHYHAERLIAAGLLVVSRSEARAGRPIRYFRAVAQRFWVPQAYLHQLPSDAWVAELRQALREESNRSGEVSLLYTSDPQGRMMVRLMRGEDAAPPRTIEIWRRLRLDPQQRDALGKDLSVLFERYSKLEAGDGAPIYLAHAAFAPLG